MFWGGLQAQADDLKYQELTKARASRHKSYPVLEGLERKLYPGLDFRGQSPSERLARLEIAVFGAQQNTSISQRLEALRLELDSRELAESPAQLKAEKSDISTAELYALKAQERRQITDERMRYSKFLMSERTKTRDANNNMRIANPIIQRLSKSSIEAMFGGKP